MGRARTSNPRPCLLRGLNPPWTHLSGARVACRHVLGPPRPRGDNSTSAPPQLFQLQSPGNSTSSRLVATLAHRPTARHKTPSTRRLRYCLKNFDYYGSSSTPLADRYQNARARIPWQPRLRIRRPVSTLTPADAPTGRRTNVLHTDEERWSKFAAWLRLLVVQVSAEIS